MIIPPPTYTEEEIEPAVPTDKEKRDWVAEYWKCDDWICSVCQARMFGRMTYCIYCKYRGEKR